MMPGEWDWMSKLPFVGNQQPAQDLPQDDTLMQLDLKRKFALADALRNQEAPQGQMVSGHYVAPSWTQQLSNLGGKYIAGKNEQEALQGYGKYISDKQLKQANALRDLSGALKPVAETTQGEYNIQVPNGQTASPTDNLGGMKPYESGMKTISVPMTTQTGTTRQPTADEITAAIGKYSSTIHDPALLEKVVMSQVTNALSPKQYDYKEANGVLYQVDSHGNMTGKTFGTGKPTDYGATANAVAQGLFGADFSKLDQPSKAKVIDKMNEIKASQLGVAQTNAANQTATTAYNTKPVETTYPNPKSNMPQMGQEVDGHIYIGGNPNDQKSWRKK
jgi:hypothetical protein